MDVISKNYAGMITAIVSTLIVIMFAISFIFGSLSDVSTTDSMITDDTTFKEAVTTATTFTYAGDTSIKTKNPYALYENILVQINNEESTLIDAINNHTIKQVSLTVRALDEANQDAYIVDDAAGTITFSESGCYYIRVEGKNTYNTPVYTTLNLAVNR